MEYTYGACVPLPYYYYKMPYHHFIRTGVTSHIQSGAGRSTRPRVCLTMNPPEKKKRIRKIKPDPMPIGRRARTHTRSTTATRDGIRFVPSGSSFRRWLAREFTIVVVVVPVYTIIACLLQRPRPVTVRRIYLGHWIRTAVQRSVCCCARRNAMTAWPCNGRDARRQLPVKRPPLPQRRRSPTSVGAVAAAVAHVRGRFAKLGDDTDNGTGVGDWRRDRGAQMLRARRNRSRQPVSEREHYRHRAMDPGVHGKPRRRPGRRTKVTSGYVRPLQVSYTA